MRLSPYVVPGIKRQFVPDKKMITQIDIDFIIDAVLRYTGVNKEDMLKRNRERRFVYSRHLIAFLLKERTNLSLREIGDLIGGKDHTTAMHSIKQIKDLSWSDPEVLQDILNIKQLI